MRLTTRTHDRDGAGLTYVYPVVSRRARGVSVGVNLNTNSACNWRCVYCQVPGLVRGAAGEIDVALLERELESMLGAITGDDWLERHVPAGSRRLNDVAFSGNGEPTTSRQLDAALAATERVLVRLGLAGELRVVLITNGSLVHRPDVRAALERLAGMHGEVWFKLDSGTPEGRRRLNDVEVSNARVEENLALAARICPTRLQTIVLSVDGEPPSEAEQEAWIALVGRVLASGAPLRDVLLYGLERESHQPERGRLGKLPAGWLEAFAARVRAELRIPVLVHP